MGFSENRPTGHHQWRGLIAYLATFHIFVLFVGPFHQWLTSL